MKKRIRRSWWLWAISKVWLWLLLVVWLVAFRLAVTFGPSMEPALHTGDVLIIARWLEPSEGDIVIAHAPGVRQPVCKRLSNIQGGLYYLLGDNTEVSLDSRDFGPVSRDNIIGVSVLEIRLGGFVQCAKSSIFA